MKNDKLKKCLTDTMNMWRWLEKHPNKIKIDYFDFKRINGWARPVSHCYCCQYVLDKFSTCDSCPLVKLWGDAEEYLVPCSMNDSSPYALWVNAAESDDTVAASKNAKKIADYCKKRLAEIKRKERK